MRNAILLFRFLSLVQVDRIKRREIESFLNRRVFYMRKIMVYTTAFYAANYGVLNEPLLQRRSLGLAVKSVYSQKCDRQID